MKFTKMQGCGNDYIYVNCFTESVENPSELAKKVSNRRFGIGSDGLILIKPSEIADFQMDMYNADGSRGKMCGNGIRCVGKYVYEHKMTEKTNILIETLSGVKSLELTLEQGAVTEATVDMGRPEFKPERIPMLAQGDAVIDQPIFVGGKEYQITAVSMGNPHTVIFVKDVSGLAIEAVGPLFEHHENFPEGVNTEFVQVLDSRNIRMRVWERGSAETGACGTGACASAMASIVNQYTDDEVIVHMLGGALKIRYDRETGHVFMTGPAVTVFEGNY